MSFSTHNPRRLSLLDRSKPLAVALIALLSGLALTAYIASIQQIIFDAFKAPGAIGIAFAAIAAIGALNGWVLCQAELPAAMATLDNCVRKITSWARKRLAMVEEGFYRGVGTAVGTGLVGLAFWVAAGGKIGAVSALLATYAGHLLGK